MSAKEKMFNSINELEEIKCNVAGVFLAEKAILKMVDEDGFNLSGTEFAGVQNIKEIILKQLDDIDVKLTEIWKGME